MVETSKTTRAVMVVLRHALVTTLVAGMCLLPLFSEDDPTQHAQQFIDHAQGPEPERFWGRSVTIAICGVDSRLGVNQAHADANHVLRIWLDRGMIQILSVPRGTYADAGFGSASLNIIANYRARKGRAAYLRKLAEMTGVGKIDYYVEVGFSQAMGIFELLGFKGSASTTLQVLRTRKAFGIGDHQRCFNQAQFIRQMILKHFPRTAGMLDALAMWSALAIAETNLRYDIVQSIIAGLRAKGFPKSERDVTIELRPRRYRVQEFDISSVEKVIALAKNLNRRLKAGSHLPRKPSFRLETYQQSLHSRLIAAARALDAGKPWRAIALLERPFQQRAWLQLPEEYGRLQFMGLLCNTLIEAYQMSGNILKAEDVGYFLSQLGVPWQQNLGARVDPSFSPTPH